MLLFDSKLSKNIKKITRKDIDLLACLCRNIAIALNQVPPFAV